MAMFRFILWAVRTDGAAASDGPSRLAILSGAAITLAVAVFILSA